MFNKEYFKDRFYVRGHSWLGILNTITAFIFNRVIVKIVKDNKIVAWYIGKGTDFPPIN